MKAYAKRISHFDETTLLVLFKRLARWLILDFSREGNCKADLVA
jgi:hypothetical protein